MKVSTLFWCAGFFVVGRASARFNVEVRPAEASPPTVEAPAEDDTRQAMLSRIVTALRDHIEWEGDDGEPKPISAGAYRLAHPGEYETRHGRVVMKPGMLIDPDGGPPLLGPVSPVGHGVVIPCPPKEVCDG